LEGLGPHLRRDKGHRGVPGAHEPCRPAEYPPVRERRSCALSWSEVRPTPRWRKQNSNVRSRAGERLFSALPSETGARKVKPLTGLGPRQRCSVAAPYSFPFVVGPRVRIRLPPAESQRTVGSNGSEAPLCRCCERSGSGPSLQHQPVGRPGPFSSGGPTHAIQVMSTSTTVSTFSILKPATKPRRSLSSCTTPSRRSRL
jgi:hypothetical protein